jgi:hypothetical protein
MAEKPKNWIFQSMKKNQSRSLPPDKSGEGDDESKEHYPDNEAMEPADEGTESRRAKLSFILKNKKK